VRFSRFISGQRRRQPTQLALVVAVGGISGKVNINDNMDVSSCFVGALSQQLVSVQATPVYTSASTTEDYIKYIKRDERFNWIRIRFD
jgi:hypothetical protein